MAEQVEKKAKIAMRKVERLKDASAYWRYLETEGKPHCMID